MPRWKKISEGPKKGNVFVLEYFIDGVWREVLDENGNRVIVVGILET